MGMLIAIIAGLIFAWIAIRVGFYVAWSVMFNLVVSIYIAISLGPFVADKLPLEGGFGAAIVLTGLAAAVFAVLQGSCYLFFTSQYEMSFPAIFDSVASGITGFLTGMLIVSFLILPVGLIRQGTVADKNTTKESYQLNSSAYLNFWYNAVHYLVGKEENVQPETLVAGIIKNNKKVKNTKAEVKVVEQVKVVEPNEVKVEEVSKDKLGTPPDFDFDKI